jgi:hypothetical protein
VKKLPVLWKLLLLFVAPLFMFNVCGKHDDDIDFTTPNADEFVTWRIPGYNAYVAAPDSVTYGYYATGVKSVVVSYTPSGSSSTYFNFDGTAAGNFSASYFNIYHAGKYFVGTSSPVQISVSSFGGPGQLIMGTYSGTVKDSTSPQTFNISGEFKVRNQ